MSNYNKLLPSGWYHSTISQARIEQRENQKGEKGASFLVLVYTINTGEFAWRNILVKYPLNKEGMEKLTNDMDEIGYAVYTNYDEEYFLNQFSEYAKHALVKVERYVSNKENIIKNIITERKVDTDEPEHDVTREKTEEHFFKGDKGRKLPLL